MFLYIAVIASLLWLYFAFFKRKSLNEIPGPRGVPIFGNLFDMDMKKPHLKLNEWAKQHGDLYKLNMFGTPILVVSGYHEIHQVLVTKGSDFGGRPYSYIADIGSEGFSEIIFTDMGPELKWRRKFVHSFVKQYSSGLMKIEQVAASAVRDLINEINEFNEMAIDIDDMLYSTLIDIICIMIRGKTVPKSDVIRLRQSLNATVRVFAIGGPGPYLDMFPWLRFFGNEAYKAIYSFIEERNSFFLPWVEEARIEQSEGFMSKIVSLPEPERKKYGVDETVMVQLASAIVTAGTSTSSRTLSFLMNILVHHPDIQKKLQTEISEIVGVRSITFMDKQNMPYHQAVLFEVSRLVSVSPFAIPRKTTRTTSINNISIPKDTQVWCNLWGLHHDERLWDNPFDFDPDRFLDADGQLVPADHPSRLHFLPFGAGTRVCVGEVFAQSRMFLILAMIMQQFSILPETDIENQPSWDPREMTMGLMLQPKPFKVVMRNHSQERTRDY